MGGLFVGPYLFYVQAIFLAINSFNPLTLVYLSIFINLLNLLLIFIVTRKMFDNWTAVIAVFLFMVSKRIYLYDTSANHTSYIMIVSILLLYSTYQSIINGKEKYIPVIALSIGASLHVHFSNFLLFIAPVITFLFYRIKLSIKSLAYMGVILLFFISPLILFDLRNNHLISHNLLNFSNVGKVGISPLEIIKIYFLLISDTIFSNLKSGYLLTAVLLVVAILEMLKNNLRRLLVLFFIFILAVPFQLVFYKGHIPEYYFLPGIPFLVITIAYSLKKLSEYFLPLTIAILIIVCFINYKNYSLIANSESFAYKNEIVDWVINDSNNRDFNVYWELAQGQNSGFNYLFKWKNKMPKDFSDQIYIMKQSDEVNFSIDKYKEQHIGKEISVKEFGRIRVVSVK